MARQNGIEVKIRLAEPLALEVDFQVDESELLALVGPSGGGKSTILRCIAGFERPAAGKIVAGGKCWYDGATGRFEHPRRRRVGMVFQSYALFPHLSALENVLEAVPPGRRDEREQKALEYLARVNLKGLEQRRPAQMSGGQRQRVAVARALAREPEVLLLDEPFSAVDKLTRIRLQRELVELRANLSIPIVFVTHDMEDAARLADRVAVLHDGRILQVAPHDELLLRPVSAEVARLIGIRNLFDGQIVTSAENQNRLDLRWGDTLLEIGDQDGLRESQVVTWCIPADGIVVHRRDRPSRGEHENPVFGRVREVFRFGQTTELALDVGDPKRLPLHCAIPTHVARRNNIGHGDEIGVSIKADMIHIMEPTQR